MDIPMLLPHAVAHWQGASNPDAFYELWEPRRVVHFWKQAMSRDEEWFRCHPLYDEIRSASESCLQKYLPIHVFGDDATMRKTKMLKTVT
jgi:hypothetical protein